MISYLLVWTSKGLARTFLTRQLTWPGFTIKLMIMSGFLVVDKLDEDKASFDCNQVSKVFPLRMEETLAESSQDMKPEQSWISEKLETVTVIEINTNNTFLSRFSLHVDLSGGGVPGGEPSKYLLPGSLLTRIFPKYPINISDIGSVLPCHLCPLRRALHAFLLHVRAHGS